MSSNTIKSTLKDFLKHTHSLGIYEMVKVTGTDEATEVETVDPEKTVIFKGVTHNPISEFADRTIGLSRMSVLDGYLKYPGFSDATAKVDMVTQDRNGETVLAEVAFVDNEGTNANYRFMSSEIVNQQLKEIKFKGASYDVSIVPTQKNLKDLIYFNSVLSQFESTFSPRTEDGNLYFYIGDNGGDRTKILVANGVDGEIKHELKWPLDIVLKILKISDGTNVTMEFNAKGLLQIKLISDVGTYTYLLPAKG